MFPLYTVARVEEEMRRSSDIVQMEFRRCWTAVENEVV
nr:MAG TPA: hypothetical protein [Bacteriophage sp.]